MVNLFGWTVSRASAARPPLARAGLRSFASAAEGEWTAEGLVRAAYLDNPVAQRAVRLVAESVGACPLDCSHDAFAALVERRSAGQPLTETVAAHLLLHGNAYVQCVADPDGALVDLYALRPDRVTVEADARGWPIAYRYRVGALDSVLTAEDGAGRTQVIHLRGFHPLDDHYGLGCLGAARDAVAVHNAATRWNRSLLENAARPSGALVYDPGEGETLSGDQFERLRDELEVAYAGAGNAGRPMVLDGGLSWQALSLSPAEMDFVALKGTAAREIALAFGVPPLMLGLPGDNTHANYAEANRALWRLSVLPLATRIFTGLAQGVAPWFPAATLAVDADRVPALGEDRERLWSRITAADFLSADEKRALLDL